jgi:hypothetical protein
VALSLTEVLADPAATATDLCTSGAVFGVEAATGRRGVAGAVILELDLASLPALAAEGFPREAVRLVIRADRVPHAFPRGDPHRRFLHRNPLPMRDLCLQYERDDPALRWMPDDGLEPLVTLVHRHLIFEEAWRRDGSWPIEDAPHGDVPAGHPLRSQLMRDAVRRWTRP